MAMLLATALPALAQENWPSEPGGTPAGPLPQTAAGERSYGPQPVAPELLTSDGADPRSADGRAPGVQLPGHLQRDRSVAPAGQPILAASGLHPETAALARQGNSLVRAIVHLNMPPLAAVSDAMTPDERIAYAAQVTALQDKVAAEVSAAGGQVLVRFSTLSSGFAAMLPSNQVARVAGLPDVAHIRGVNDYILDLSETVPHVGASWLQGIGLTGKGVNVAVIDSGVDFTHRAFGGPGTVAAWEDAYFGDCLHPQAFDPGCAANHPANPALFGPAAPKVKGGYDWLGEKWPVAGLPEPDPNPVDFEGHGTSVADIIAGMGYAAGANEDGAYPAKGPGMAPSANIWAFKACASYSTSCNGVALLASVDDAADLDNNPATKDPADIINMSLGSPYGQPEDDLSYFSSQAAAYGIIVVASAGNSADKPFIMGSPSSADGVISVAQTTVPSEKQYLPETDGPITVTLRSAVFQPWSVPVENFGVISGTLAYGNGDNSNRNGCAAYTDDMTGKVVLADRGSCNFSLKAKNASAAGAVLSFIGLVAPGDAFTGGDGGDRPIDIPSFMINQAESNQLKAALQQGTTTITIDPAVFIGLVDSMVGSSSRGPRNNDNAIKPDIGAPGASVSAVAGSGSGTGAFGGTSGAAPMVSGAAALLKGHFKNYFSVQQYKSLLMNSANSEIYLKGSLESGGTGELAPITRIGGGQVDVAAAYTSRLVAWDSTDKSNPLSWGGSISFGYVPVTDRTVITRQLSIKNIGTLGQSVGLSSFFRYGDDFRQGLFVDVGARSVYIPAGGTVEVPVVLKMYGGGLPEQALDPLHTWLLNKGSQGANGSLLSFQEYDGYIYLTPQTGQVISVPWHVLPKDAADVELALGRGMPGSSALVNFSPAHPGVSEGFSLVDVNPNDYGYTVGQCGDLGLAPGCNSTVLDLKEFGVRDYPTQSGHLVEFALTLWDEPFRSSQYPLEADIYIDSNRDGTNDFVVFNGDLTLNAADGRNAVFVDNLSTNSRSAFFFTDSDFNTQNYILTVPAAAVGLAPGQAFNFAVYLFDAYFTGALTDCSPRVGSGCGGKHTYTVGQPRYDLGLDDLTILTAPDDFTVFDWTSSTAGDLASPSQIGLLFLHRYAPIGAESDHLLLAPPFVAAEGLETVALPPVAPVGTEIVISATLTTTLGVAAGHGVHFTDGFFSAELSGANESPNPVTMTVASGVANFQVDFATGAVSYNLNVTDIVSPTAAHIHVGRAGTNGGVIHWLFDASGVKAPSSFPATGVITMTNSQLLTMAEEGLYVNVHSSGYPAGEIRGQITGAESSYTDQAGQATIVVTSTVPASEMLYVLSGNLMDTVEYSFVEAAAISLSARTPDVLVGQSVTVTATVTDSSAMPMVGEKVFATDGVLTASLSGSQENPANDSAATGEAVFVIDLAGRNRAAGAINVSYTLTVTGLADVTGAHVHYGAAGVNGPVAHALQVGSGSFQLKDADLLALLKGELYVNVHSSARPGGEIRGQITGAGAGTTGSNGETDLGLTAGRVGTVTIYAVPQTNPLTLMGQADVNVSGLKVFLPGTTK